MSTLPSLDMVGIRSQPQQAHAFTHLLLLQRGVHGILLFDSQYAGPERLVSQHTFFCKLGSKNLAITPSYTSGEYSSTLVGLFSRKPRLPLSAHSSQSNSVRPT